MDTIPLTVPMYSLTPSLSNTFASLLNSNVPLCSLEIDNEYSLFAKSIGDTCSTTASAVTIVASLTSYCRILSVAEGIACDSFIEIASLLSSVNPESDANTVLSIG